jgi:hypothetical protein
MPPLGLITAAVLLASLLASVQEAQADLNDVAKALGASTVKSIQFTGTGGVNAVGQNIVPGLPWPEDNVKSHTRSVNYDTASLRDEQARTQALDPARYGGLQPIRDEQRLNLLVSGDVAWNSMGDQPVSAPIAERRQHERLSGPGCPALVPVTAT